MQVQKNTNEWILHIDGDSFFAACEVSRRPDLFGKPVVVGEERGIATALTYPAKALGIKRGDPIYMIRKEYPKVTVLSSHFELYRKFAYNLATILIPEVKDFEAYSIDECFATVVGTQEEVKDKVSKLKSHIQKKLGITYSFGVAKTKTLAKVASKRNKPNGICFLMNPPEIIEALKTTKVGDIWGVGWATDRKLQGYKIRTAYEYITTPITDTLASRLNINSFQTREELMGMRHYDVGSDNAHKKSIQSTRTFLKKTCLKKELYGELSRNVEVACSSMREDNLVTNHFYFFVKPKTRGQKYIQKLIELPFYTNSDTTIMKYIEHAFENDLELGTHTDVLYKKSGVTMLGLKDVDELPPDLFGEQSKSLNEEYGITHLIDRLRNKYGFGVISLASSLEQNSKRKDDYVRRHKQDVYISGLPFPFLGLVT